MEGKIDSSYYHTKSKKLKQPQIDDIVPDLPVNIASEFIDRLRNKID